MNRDAITRLAREAGLHIATDVAWMPIIGFEYAEKLIQLAQAAEREACANVCEVSPEFEDWEIQCGAEGRQLLNDMAAAIRARGQE